MLVYAIISQKGGVGKTTTSANLAAALTEQGKRVLLVDLDPQGSLTAAVGRQAGAVTIGDVLQNPAAILTAIYPCTGSMHVVTATATLASVFLELAITGAPAFRLARALRLVQHCYDYTIVDCPPALGHATTNAMTAANVALIPLQCEYLSVRGLADVQVIASEIQDSTNADLRVRVVATMFDKRTLHAQDVLKEARHALPGLVFDTIIPRTISLAEAPACGQTIMRYAPDSRGAEAYRSLANEILNEDEGYGSPSRQDSIVTSVIERVPVAA